MENSRTKKMAELLESLRNGAGNLAEACAMAHVDYFEAHQMLESDEGFRQVFESRLKIAEQRALDMAESQLSLRIQRGDMQAARFLLATKGRDRGYGEAIDKKAEIGVIDLDQAAKKIAFMLNNKERKALDFNKIIDVTPEIEH